MVDDDGRTDDGRTTDHGHPKSSPCEPNSSGELKNCEIKIKQKHVNIQSMVFLELVQ